ncbi:MAG: class I SAM-dependent methyltransferase [Rhodospirillaceae bacterium]|nr:class I SAM-dependent methyltransferase [Rhodospirillaceae bacterium]
MGARDTGAVAVDAPALAEGVTAGGDSGVRSACPLCAGTDHEIVGTRDRSGAPLTSALCRACGHVYTVPRPTAQDLSAYYALRYRQDYKSVAAPKAKHVWRAGQRAAERLLHLLNAVRPPAAVLDVGAGGGEFVYLARRAGFAARGIEPHQGYAAHARERLGLDVANADFQSADIAAHSCDVITLHHVLEHLPDPPAAMARLRGWLKPAGRLIVEVPNVLSWYHAPRRRFHRAHVQSFNRTGLENLIANAGFEVIAVQLTPHTAHLNLVARKADPPPSITWRDASAEVRDGLARHTALAHALSGRPLRRLWANLKRPLAERRALMRIKGAPDARAILDAIAREHGWTA